MALALVTARLELRPYRIAEVERIHAVLYGDAASMGLIGFTPAGRRQACGGDLHCCELDRPKPGDRS